MQEGLIKEMQQLQGKLSQTEREIKKRRLEKTKFDKKMNQFKTIQKELLEKKKMIFRERRRLSEEERKIKWRLEELKREESRTIPEISKMEKEIQELQNTLRWHEADLFTLQGENMKLERNYRQLLKARQDMERMGKI